MEKKKKKKKNGPQGRAKVASEVQTFFGDAKFSPNDSETQKIHQTEKRKSSSNQSATVLSLCSASVSCFLQSIMLLLHSQRRYVFEYDQTDRLVAVTMPSMVKHALQSLLSIGYYRNIYTPPDSQSSFMQDYTLDGRLMRTQYLGTGRSVIYRYWALLAIGLISPFGEAMQCGRGDIGDTSGQIFYETWRHYASWHYSQPYKNITLIGLRKVP